MSTLRLDEVHILEPRVDLRQDIDGNAREQTSLVKVRKRCQTEIEEVLPLLYPHLIRSERKIRHKTFMENGLCLPIHFV